MRYKLPPILGERECVFVARGYETDCTIVALTEGIPGLRIEIETQHLTPVPEPLPEEPPVGSVVLALLADEDEPWAFERSDRSPNGKEWYGAGRDQGYVWPDLCTRGAPVRLVPAPEPVTLPWSGSSLYSSGIRVALGHDDPINLTVGGGQVGLGPEGARAMANALLTAADQAKAVGSDG